MQGCASHGQLSMLSLTERHNAAYVDSTAALYRGVKVAVYKVDKTELRLHRNDLIELVNVSRHWTPAWGQKLHRSDPTLGG